MLTLAIHTAGSSCDIALMRDGEVIGRQSEDMKRGHDQRLPVLTEALLLTNGISLSDVDQFAVCVGPGSFTGIRVGVAFMRGLALAHGKTAIGVTSLEAMYAEQVKQPVLALLPAKQRPPDVSFWAQGRGLSGLEEPAEISVSDLKGYLTEDTKLLVPEDQMDILASHLGEGLTLTPAVSCSMAVARVAQTFDDASFRPASPVYVREPDAIPAKPVAHVED